ncbi:MAG TPA: diguanylate cyclase [Syntrophales bacterium]|nr:diguanylate cyclase [Syntrophales bacterium]HPQ45348.1 diguanylate cyclase [Syntrophales bacterium]
MDKRDKLPAEPDQDAEALLWRLAELEREVASLRDLNETLQENEQKYRLIAEHSGDCIWTMDLKTLRFTYVSPSVAQIYGGTPEETIELGIDAVLPPHSVEIVMKVMEEEMALEANGADPHRSRIIEIEEYRKDRSIIWIENVLSFLRDEEQRPIAILGVSRDITERKALGDELRTLAVTDPLTGAFNRRYFMEELHRDMNRCNRYEVPFSLIMLDVDHFKSVNDCFGHETGDQVLKELVHLIQQRIRVSDILARWGGEEFLIMLVNTPLLKAIKLAEALLEGMRSRLFPCIGLLTASFGVTQYRKSESADTILTRVDNLMYQAKEKGRARISHDDTSLGDVAAS